jgi:hypothetical protein
MIPRFQHVSVCLLTTLALGTSDCLAATTAPDLGLALCAQDPKPKSVDPIDAEREKMRLKDVEGWKKLQVKSLDDVLDVKKATQPLELPAEITEEEKTKMAELLQRAKDGEGGAATGRSLRALEKIGWPVLWFLANHLREINYKDPTEAFFAYQLNATMQNITMGVNTGYVAVEIGEPMDPRKAQWNAMTVSQWQLGIKAQWPTREKFAEYIKNRKAKRDAELEGKGDKLEDEKKDDKKKGETKEAGKG